MAHWINDLEDLCEKVTDEIAEVNKKMKNSGGKLSAGDVEYIDKLTHTLKSIKTTIAMGEYDDDYSNDYDQRTGTYAMGGDRSYRGGRSYARGRGRNASRDSMGRYTNTGYSRDDAMQDMADDIRSSMPSMSEHLRREAEKFLHKIEQEM